MKKILVLIAITACGCSRSLPDDVTRETYTFQNRLNEFQLQSGEWRSTRSHSLSRTAFAADLERTKQQLSQLEAIDTSLLLFDDLIDWKFAHSILSGLALEQAAESWKRDPRAYMSFTSLSSTIAGP